MVVMAAAATASLLLVVALVAPKVTATLVVAVVVVDTQPSREARPFSSRPVVVVVEQALESRVPRVLVVPAADPVGSPGQLRVVAVAVPEQLRRVVRSALAEVAVRLVPQTLEVPEVATLVTLTVAVAAAAAAGPAGVAVALLSAKPPEVAAAAADRRS